MRIGVQVVTPPTEEPVTLTEAKARLRVDGTEEDTDVAALIAECREACEDETQRAFVTQTLTATFDRFPIGEFHLPRPPLQSVAWVKYYDLSGTLQTLDPSLYHVAAAGEPGRIRHAFGIIWPFTQFGRPEAVQVQYVAGYGGASAVPGKAKAAIKLLMADRYMHRGDGSPEEFPAACRRLLNSLEFGEVN